MGFQFAGVVKRRWMVLVAVVVVAVAGSASIGCTASSALTTTFRLLLASRI